MSAPRRDKDTVFGQELSPEASNLVNNLGQLLSPSGLPQESTPLPGIPQNLLDIFAPVIHEDGGVVNAMDKFLPPKEKKPFALQNKISSATDDPDIQIEWAMINYNIYRKPDPSNKENQDPVSKDAVKTELQDLSWKHRIEESDGAEKKPKDSPSTGYPDVEIDSISTVHVAPCKQSQGSDSKDATEPLLDLSPKIQELASTDNLQQSSQEMDSTQKGAQLNSSKGLTVCPYDNTHQISDEELAAHLENCRQVDHKTKVENCDAVVRYACRHCLELVYAPEVAIHEQSCSQKFLISLQQLVERLGNTNVATDRKKTPKKRKAPEKNAVAKIRKVNARTSAEVKKSSRRTRQTKTESEVVAEDSGQVEKVLVVKDKKKPLKRLQASTKKGTKARKYSKKTTGKTKQNGAESGGVKTDGESKSEDCEKGKSKVFVCNLNIPRFNFRRYERENE